MPKTDERVQLIGASILNQAEKQSKDIIAQANQIRQREISACEEETVQTMFNMVQKKSAGIRQDSVRKVASAQIKAQQQLMRRREELTSTVFASVKTRLFEYAGSSAYQMWLLGEVEKLGNSWDHSATTVYLRETDLALKPRIESLLPGCTIQEDAGIKIGGFRLFNRNAAIRVDETLDSRLEAQRPWFLETCGMKVTD